MSPNQSNDFVAGYYQQMKTAIDSIKHSEIVTLAAKIREINKAGGHIYFCGNGGSASISNHFLCDLNKGCRVEHSSEKFKSHSLSANIEMITAIANDIAYDQVFSYQLEGYLTSKDLLIAVSSSGNSPNIIRAVEFAKTQKAYTVGLAGFAGGKLKELADFCIHVPVKNYGITEDLHQSVMHAVTQLIKEQQLSEK